MWGFRQGRGCPGEWLRLQQLIVCDVIGHAARERQENEQKSCKKNHAPKLIEAVQLVKKTLLNSP